MDIYMYQIQFDYSDVSFVVKYIYVLDIESAWHVYFIWAFAIPIYVYLGIVKCILF